MATEHIAVIDVGKTNKKVLVFNRELVLLESAYKKFEEVVRDDVHYEPVEEIFEWVKEQLKKFARDFNIRAISVTTQGATAVCVDEDGNPAVPPVAYTTQADEAFRRRFYETCGDRETLQQKTATAEIGDMINVAKLLFFSKETWPEQFERTQHILNYPQYFGYCLTGVAGAEPTYTGCHTYLYDFHKKAYSSVADALGVRDKLPTPIRKSWEVLGTVQQSVAQETGLSTDCIVTMGIHDSNSSLLPYLVKGYDNFVLNSTGTWCVAMHPTDSVSFRPDELGKLVFYNMDAFFNPVKTSIFMGGLEYETYTELIGQLTPGAVKPAFDQERLQRIINERQLFILPSVVRGTGLFPDAAPKIVEGDREYPLEDVQSGKAVPDFLRDSETAYDVLNLSLAVQTRKALDMAGFTGGDIFTEGGFRKNVTYNRLMTALYDDSRVSLTGLEEATAFGAAMLARAALDNTTPAETSAVFDIYTEPVPSPGLQGLHDYIQAFTAGLGN